MRKVIKIEVEVYADSDAVDKLIEHVEAGYEVLSIAPPAHSMIGETPIVSAKRAERPAPHKGGTMRLVGETTVEPVFTEGEPVVVRHYEGDYTTPDGYHHIGGVHRVTATYKTGKSYQRAKTFKGESAWSRAERLFGDIVSDVRYSR